MRLLGIEFFYILLLSFTCFSEGVAYVIVQPIEAYSSEMDIKNVKKLDHLTISAAKNEIESASFYIQNNSKQPITLTIEVTNLRNEKSTVESSAIDTKYLIEWYQSNGAWETHRQTKKDKFKPILVRELLVNDPELILVNRKDKTNSILIGKDNKEYYKLSRKALKHKEPVEANAKRFYIKDSDTLKPITLNANQIVQIWLTFKPYKGILAGKYQGKIIIKEGRDIVKQQELNLKILDFKLDDPQQIYSIYYRGNLAKQGSISSEAKSATQLATEFLNMSEHGISHPTVYQRILPKKSINSEKELRSLFGQYMEIRNEAGISNNVIYYLGLQTGGQKTRKEIDSLNYGLSQLKQVLDEYGVKQIYIYGKEEVKGLELTRQMPIWEETKRKGYKIFVAGYKGFFNEVENAVDLLVYHNKIDQNIVIKAHNNNTKIFSYANPQVGIENPAVYRKNYGFSLIIAKFDGVMDYAYQHAMGFIWNDFDNKVYRDHVFAYPTSEGVIDTLAWEGFREAVDDARYYSTAVNKIKKKQGVDGERKLYNWLLSQCSLTKCNPEYIRQQLVKVIEEN